MSAPTFGVSSGLLDPRHVAAMGSAIWEFLYLLDRQTSEDGRVNKGRPILVEEISARTGRGDRATRGGIARLVAAGYVTKQKHSGGGLVFSVCNPKKRFKQDKPSGRNVPDGPAQTCRTEEQPSGTNVPDLRHKRAGRTILLQQNSKGESTPQNGAPLFDLRSPEKPPTLTPFRALEIIAQAGGLELGKPPAKDLKLAKDLIGAYGDLTEDDVRLTVAHLLKADPGYWNVRRRIDPAAIREHLPIARKAKATAEPDVLETMMDRSRYFGYGARPGARSDAA